MADLSTDSTSPTVVTTSDPAVESGKTNVIRFSERVKAFLDSLSPPGATVHDTGWVALTVTPGVATGVYCEVRRIGKMVIWRAEFHTVTPGTLCMIPGGFRTTRRFQAIALRYASTTTTNYASVSFVADGTVLVSITGTAVTTTPGYTATAVWTTD